MTRPALQAASPASPASRYYDTRPGIRLFRLGLGAVQRLWPALAVRAAYRLFATPLPLRLLQARTPWGPDWHIESWPFEAAGLTLYSPASASGPSAGGPVASGPTALLVHGWGGHAGQMRALAQALAEGGMRPVILELPAHGRSAGTSSNLPQFTRAIEYACARLQQEGHDLQLALAHSLAANALAQAASRGLDAPRLVLLAPPASPFEFTRMFAQVFGLKESVRASMQRRIESREGILMKRFEPAMVGPRIRARTLVVHDRGDAVNRFADGEAFAHAIANARLVATDGLGHRKLLQDPKVLEQVVAFAASAQSSSASAA